MSLELTGPSAFEHLELLANEIFLPILSNQQNQVKYKYIFVWMTWTIVTIRHNNQEHPVTSDVLDTYTFVYESMLIVVEHSTSRPLTPPPPFLLLSGQVGRDGDARDHGPLLHLLVGHHHHVRADQGADTPAHAPRRPLGHQVQRKEQVRTLGKTWKNMERHGFRGVASSTEEKRVERRTRLSRGLCVKRILSLTPCFVCLFVCVKRISLLEGAIITWTKQIRNVLKQDSESQLKQVHRNTIIHTKHRQNTHRV